MLQQLQLALKETIQDIKFDRIDGNITYYKIIYADGSIGEMPIYTSGAGIPAGGIEGQILSKVGNNDYESQWIDIPNPNYSDATNKPQINGVELNGDKSLEDLGMESLTNSELEEILK